MEEALPERIVECPRCTRRFQKDSGQMFTCKLCGSNSDSCQHVCCPHCGYSWSLVVIQPD